MTDKQTPAFPGEFSSGMDLRDHFAGEALPAVIAEYRQQFDELKRCGVKLPGTRAERCAADAYTYADAMMEARDK